MNMQVIDCTLRDGGNFNNWFFSAEDIGQIIRNLDKANVNIIEIGYVGGSGSNKEKSVGSLANCTPELLDELPNTSHSQLAAMVVPSVCELHLLDNLNQQQIPWIRVASYPHNAEDALPYIEHLKNQGFHVSFNVMAASYIEEKDVAELAKKANVFGADVFYMADSFGNLTPDGVRNRVAAACDQADCSVGFHGHNNLGLAFANALAAMDSGAAFIDTSLCGMARGAGNLPTEQFVSALHHWDKFDIPYKLDPILTAAEYVLSSILSSPMRISTPEIISGISNIHYYYYDLVIRKCQEVNLDPLEVAALLGKSLPKKVDMSSIESVIEQNFRQESAK
ncbi:aldolase [Bacillus tequilensis]|uniref:aldolase n=1 Tax=Bacillus tequilensis TaxID=227866 RepID=UPI0004653838|nr:aldolase [Bacillus tequilensis]MDR4432794.1 aldolase [Bacillus tequilensis]SPT93605.1 aldolase class II [Bacillus tequilensis]